MTVTLKLEGRPSDPSTRRSLSDLSLAVAKCKKIIVVTGAGISCSCGIPDFRSSDGLYNLVKQQYPDVILKGRDLFDASLFRDPTSTSVFYTFISQLKQSIDSASPAPTHQFIKTLDSKGRLLRSYTQNIDGLEAKAGLLGSSSQEVKSVGKGKSKIRMHDVRNVQLHGDIHRVRCTFCSGEFPCTSEHLSLFNKGIAPDCPECTTRSEARVARSARSLKIGTLRPAIVLYDEPHPLGDDIGTIQTADVLRKPEMLIIMGTSLKVHGLKKLVKDFAKAVHASAPTPLSSTKKSKSCAGKVIFVNKTPPGSEWAGIIDYHVAGETDSWVEKVVEDWKKMRPADWEVQKKLVALNGESGAFKLTKEVSTTAGKGKVGSRKGLGVENVRPADVFDFEDKVISIKNAVLTPPVSPSKRRQAASHYSDLESSPSKKRSVVTRTGNRAFEERGLLFGDSTNKSTDDFDLGEVKLVKGRRTRTQAVSVVESEVKPPQKKKPALTKKPSQVYVELGKNVRNAVK